MSIFKKLTLEEEMLQYLHKKYGKEEPFKILGTNCQSMFSKSHESKAISERFPNEVITIIKYKSHGKIHIEDNFIEICRRDEISQVYADLIKGIYPKYTVKLHALSPVAIVLPEDIDINTPVEKIIHHKELVSIMINLYVEDNVDKKDIRLKELKNLVINNFGNLNIYVSYCKDKNDINTCYLSGYARIDYKFEENQVTWRKIS